MQRSKEKNSSTNFAKIDDNSDMVSLDIEDKTQSMGVSSPNCGKITSDDNIEKGMFQKFGVFDDLKKHEDKIQAMKDFICKLKSVLPRGLMQKLGSLADMKDDFKKNEKMIETLLKLKSIYDNHRTARIPQKRIVGSIMLLALLCVFEIHKYQPAAAHRQMQQVEDFNQELTVLNAHSTQSIMNDTDVHIYALKMQQKGLLDREREFQDREDELLALKADYDKLQNKYSSEVADKEATVKALQYQIGNLEKTDMSTQNDVGNLNVFENKHSVCKALGDIASVGTGSATASNIWSKNLPLLVQASQHPMDIDFAEGVTVHNMLLDLSPALLQRGLKVRPKPEEIARILNIVERRRMNPVTAPPLKVLVMGGSVTEGRGCNQNGIKDRDCNWSVRLESFVNKILGFDAVKVVNMAYGGTHTQQGTDAIKYWMYPDAVLPDGPDIIIHAYGANDSNLGILKDTENKMDRIMHLFQQGVERLNGFIKTVHEAHSCPAPIIFHLDDYVGGHSQGGILQDMVYNMIMTKVAGWYDNFAISSADVVRKLIYPSTIEENSYSPPWKMIPESGQYGENCHFGWHGHQMIVWVWAYSFLDSLVDYCENKDAQLHYYSHETQLGDERNSRITETAQRIMETAYVPPPLLPSTRLETVSDAWTDEIAKQTDHCNGVAGGIPCEFKWMTGPAGRSNTPGALQNYLSPFIEEDKSRNWRIEVDNNHGWARKLGIVLDPDSVLQFKVPQLQTPAKVLTIQSLKSYGEKWDGSMMQVQVLYTANDGIEIEALNASIEGYHTSHTSVQYSTELMLWTFVPEGSDVTIKLSLTGGTTFKVMGMMLCSR